MGNKYNKGSEWRKWDLHIHTPGTAKNDQFGSNSWEDYLKKLESKNDFSVIGITDYFSLDNYLKIKDFQDKGRLQNKYLIPNVELRLLPVTDTNTPINLHILFNPETATTTIEREFFRKLKFNYKGAEYSCIKADLIELGRIYKDNPSLDEIAAWKEGIGQFNISFTDLKGILDGNILSGHYLIGVSNSKNDGISGIQHSSLAATRQEIYRLSDFIFSGNPKDTKYFLGKGVDSTKKVKEDYGSLKPCITSSDAHSLSQVCEFKTDRFTWIKADPTFEGLKQIVIEPEERVFIGDEPEILKRINNNKTKYIKGLKINPTNGYKNQYGKWFKDIDVEFNKELVAIIGNKGSGKSALSDIAALCGNFKNHESFSFLHQKKFRKNKLALNFESTLIWESKTEDKRNLQDEPKDDQILNVKYLPQGDFEYLTNEIDKTDEFQKEIENIVFSHIEKEEKLGFDSFESLINNQKKTSYDKINSIKDSISQLNYEIIQLEKKLNLKYKLELEGNLKKKQEELKALKEPEVVENPNSDSEIARQNKEVIDKIDDINKELAKLEKDFSKTKKSNEKLAIEIAELKEFKESIKLKKEELISFKEINKEKLKKYDIEIDKVLKIKIDLTKVNARIKNNENIVKKNNRKINGTEGDKGLITQIEVQNSFLLNAQNNLDKPQKKYQKYLNEKREWDKNKSLIEGDESTPETLKYYQKQINYIENDLTNDIGNKRAKRIERVRDIYGNKKNVLSIYNKAKDGIDSRIKDNQDLLQEYKISIEASLILNSSFKEEFISFISQNKIGSFYSTEGGKTQLNDLLEGKDFNNIDDVVLFLNTSIEYLLNDKREKQNNDERFIDEQIKNIEEFYRYLFSLDYIEYDYQLKLGDKQIEQLSPGERGALLLIFYLLLDKNDIPLILDQPEDNLDNHSVANVLVPFIRRAKQQRQIILVTHNPNLAVVADAEQIIWVDIDKKNRNKFKYISGSIENKEINKKIVNVLEGTMPAFNKRKQKYYE